MTNFAEEFQNIREEVFQTIRSDKNNVQDKSIDILKNLTEYIVDGGSYKTQAEALIDILFKHIELERDDWKRVRSVIEHENNLTNNRITWFVATQAFLIAAFTTVFSQCIKNNETCQDVLRLCPILYLVIAITGAISCVFIYVSLYHGRIQLDRLDKWWHIGREWRSFTSILDESKRQVGRESASKSHPPLQGSVKLTIDKFLRFDLISVYFLFLWLSGIIFTFIKLIRPEGFCFYTNFGLAFISIMLSIPLIWFFSLFLKNDM